MEKVKVKIEHANWMIFFLLMTFLSLFTYAILDMKRNISEIVKNQEIMIFQINGVFFPELLKEKK
jgi:hypothetical protein